MASIFWDSFVYLHPQYHITESEKMHDYTIYMTLYNIVTSINIKNTVVQTNKRLFMPNFHILCMIKIWMHENTDDVDIKFSYYRIILL